MVDTYFIVCLAGMLLLVERSALPQGQKKMNCPTCRRRANVTEVAYVVNASEKEELDPLREELQGGEKEKDDVDFVSSVKGSFGTKVCSVSCKSIDVSISQ